MKTQLLRVSVWAVAVSSLVLCAECEEVKAEADVPVFTTAATADPVSPGELPNSATTPQSTNALPEGPSATPDQPPAVKVVQTPVAPADVHASPALAGVIKLAQAGVSEEVMLAYIGNSSQPFSVGPDQVVYLNDLGVSSVVITSLLQHDSSAGVPGSKSTPQLPPGLALTSPATNIYPTTYSPPAVPPPPAPAYDPADPDAYATAPVVEAEPPPAPDYFYGSLSPYGSWVDVEGYGRCWQPTVAVASPSWRPYCDRGHWLWTDAGWYWYSDYSWGWAPFHYGRWCSAPRLGWFWVPDTCWGPSWVSWRHTSGYCGWAPLPPAARFVSGVGFYHRGISVGIGFDFGLGAGLYTFVPLAHFSDRSFQNHRVSGSQAGVIYRNSTVVNNYVVHNTTVINNGIGVEAVSRASGRNIPTVTVRTGDHLAGDKPVRHEQLQNNGSSLAVVRPPLPAPSGRARLSSGNRAGFSTVSQPGNNLQPAASLASPTPALTPKASSAGAPAGTSLRDKPTPPLHGQEIVRNSSTAWQPQARPSVGSTSPRTETPASPANLIPAVGQRPAAVQTPPANRVANSNPQFGAQSPWYRVYPSTPAPASPQIESVAPQFGRNVASAPMQSRVQFAPGQGVMASPNHYSEPTRSPAMRIEPSRPAAPAPSAPHAAPARSSDARSGGGKRVSS